MLAIIILSIPLHCAAYMPQDPIPGTQSPTVPAPIPKGVPEHLAFPMGYRPTPGAAYCGLHIPGAIDGKDWECYSVLLELSEAQRDALSNAYDLYRRADWDYRKRVAQPLWDESVGVSARAGSQMTAASVEEKSAIFRRADAIVPEISAIEGAFMTEIRQVLSDPQLELLEVMRLHRERTRSRVSASPYPAYWYDLDTELVALRISGMDMRPHDAEIYQSLIQSWRGAATNLYARLHDETRELLHKGNQVRAALFALNPREQADEHAELEEQFLQFTRRTTKTAGRIFKLHEQYVRLIADQLPSETGKRLRSDFLRKAYAPFYPDPCELTPVFEAAAASGLDDQQTAAVAAIREDWLATTTPKLKTMLKEYMEWREQTFIRSGYRLSDYADYAGRMRALVDHRVGKSESTVEAMLIVFNDEQTQKVEPVLEAWRMQMLQFKGRRIAKEDRFKGWPGPYE